MNNIDLKQNDDLTLLNNQKRVLKLIIDHKQTTVKKLAHDLRLSIPTIISITTHLLEVGIIKTCGHIQTKRGRKPVQYALNEKFKYIIAIDLGQNKMYIGLSDLDGNFLEIKDEYFNNHENINLADKLTYSIMRILQNNNLKQPDIARIVIGNRGVVNEDTGAISYAGGNAVWKSQPVKLFLEETFACPVIVKNDINLSAIGEQKQAKEKGYSNFAFFRFDIGVKAGIIINDELYEGFDGAAGEIGFSAVNLLEDITESKRRMEDFLTINNLCKEVWQELGYTKNSSLFLRCIKTGEQLTAKLLGEYYLSDKVTNEILSNYVIRLGNLIINFISIINVPVIILGGDIVDLGDEFLVNLQKYIDRNGFFSPKVMYSSIKEYSGLLGGVSVGITAFLDLDF